MASTFGDTLKPMGFAEDAAASMSVELAQLATDLGSFNDMPMDKALQRLQGTLIGNHENALAFGVIINENTLKQELARMGADNLTGTMLEQAKVQARMNLLMAGTTDAQGDALRTSGSWANQMRRLKSTLTDAATELGKKLLPALTPVLSMIGQLATSAIPFLTQGFEKIMPFIQGVASGIQEMVLAFQEGDGLLGGVTSLVWEMMAAFGATDEQLEFVRDKIKEVWGQVIQLKDRVLEFIEPIQNWIQNNIQLKDVLIGLAVILGGVVLSSIISVGVAIAPIVLLVGAIIGAVALLRTAWENNWGGIQEKTAAFLEFITPKWEDLKLWLGENIPKAIETLRGFWEDTLLPAMEKVGIWLQETLIPFIQDTLVPWLQEKIPAAIETLRGFWEDTLLPALERIWEFLTIDMLPIWESLAEFFDAGMTLAITALAGLWEKTLLPALREIWKFLQEKIIPKFKEFKNDVINPLKESFGGLGNMIQNVSDFLDGLTDRLANVELPDWMTPGSPTPWEIGLKGVRHQLQGLTTGDLPRFNNELMNTGNNNITNNRVVNQNMTIHTSNVDTRGESRAALQFATGGT
jgi:phage-related protein